MQTTRAGAWPGVSNSSWYSIPAAAPVGARLPLGTAGVLLTAEWALWRARVGDEQVHPIGLRLGSAAVVLLACLFLGTVMVRDVQAYHAFVQGNTLRDRAMATEDITGRRALLNRAAEAYGQAAEVKSLMYAGGEVPEDPPGHVGRRYLQTLRSGMVTAQYLLREDPVTIWGSGKARQYREKSFAHPACRTCEDFPVCHGACPLYWENAGAGMKYNVYRRDYGAGGVYECLAPGTTQTFYTDKNIPDEKVYGYVVTAIDDRGRMSVPSPEISP